MRVEIAAITSVEYKHSLLIRDHVLRKPLGMRLEDEDLSREGDYLHLVAVDEDRVVGCVVLVPNSETKEGRLKQMATLEPYRGRGYGKTLVLQLEKHAKRMGLNQVVLHARHHATGFYEKLGYTISSEVFQEVGMDHYEMRKKI